MRHLTWLFMVTVMAAGVGCRGMAGPHCSQVGDPCDSDRDCNCGTGRCINRICGGSHLQPIGWPCTHDDDCSSLTCSEAGWCTDNCGQEADCGSYASCVKTSTGSLSCFPKCSTDADCSRFYATCRLGITPNVSHASVCSHNVGDLGDSSERSDASNVGDAGERQDASKIGDASGQQDDSDAGEPCAPRQVTCGLCGTQTVYCDGTIGPCLGQRACAPGDIYYTDDGCSQRTCGADCRWGLWKLKPGNQCDSGGVNGCNAGIDCPWTGKQTCVSCRWSPCSC